MFKLSEPPIRLLDAEPDLIRFVPARHRDEARGVLFPVHCVGKGPFEIGEVLAETGSFGAMLLEGMVLHDLQMGGRRGARLLGPGDFVFRTHIARSSLVGDSSCRVVVATRVALLGHDALLASRRWPQLVAGLQARAAEQTERIIAQLLICQLPRVEDRVLSMLWLLAESWGSVGPGGTQLPVRLTHETLGALIGAQRSTVTLALRELGERGDVVRQEHGFLLVGRPPAGANVPYIDGPEMTARGATGWTHAETSRPTPPAPDPSAIRASLRDLHDHHARTVASSRDFLLRVRDTRERSRQLRAEASAIRSRRAPS